MAQMKEQLKTPEKELSNEDIANLSDAEFKTLVIRMLTELIEYGCKTKKEVKAMQSEIKKNIQGTNSEGKETRTRINMQVQEAQRVPKKLDPRINIPRHIIITLPKIKDKERILKAARKKLPTK